MADELTPLQETVSSHAKQLEQVLTETEMLQAVCEKLHVISDEKGQLILAPKSSIDKVLTDTHGQTEY